MAPPLVPNMVLRAPSSPSLFSWGNTGWDTLMDWHQQQRKKLRTAEAEFRQWKVGEGTGSSWPWDFPLTLGNSMGVLKEQGEGRGEHWKRGEYFGNSRMVVFTQRVLVAFQFPLTLTWTVGSDQTPLVGFYLLIPGIQEAWAIVKGEITRDPWQFPQIPQIKLLCYFESL